MPNLFCILKDIASLWGVDNVFMEDGTPFILSSFFPTTRLPKMVLWLFYRVEVLDCQVSCLRDNLWYTICLGSPYDYYTVKVRVTK